MKQSMQECVSYCKELKLLYVEDNDDARAFTMEMLKRFFNHIEIAKDGVEGLDIYKKSKFDLVLTDINMPNMNGIDMAKEIKNIDSSTIVLILSAHNETEYFISSIRLGIDGFLLKPIELTQFIDVLNKVVEKIHLRKEIKNYQLELESSNIILEKKVKERTSELEYRLYHDQLTELGNHEAMMRDIKKDSLKTVVLIDINGFQKFNDLYGLNAGNTILRKFSETLKEFNKENEHSLYRIYADVFVILFHSQNITDKSFKEDAQRLLSLIKSHKIYIEEIDEEIEIDSTIGVSFNQYNSFTKADMALKHAKREHKSILLYTPEIDSIEQLTQDLYWKKEIKTAINNNNIIPVFQAIVNKKGEVIKYETLMRLIQYKDNKKEVITPFFFLEASIKTRQYDKLTRIIVQKSFKIMSNEDVDFSINLSFEDLADPSRIEFLHDQIIKYGVGDRLIIEILESEVVSDYTMVTDILNDFKKHGVRIAIDDFGSGFSNFEHILKLNPDYIKIDASLIKNILIDEKSFTLVKAISEFSKELGMKVIAEHVSTKEIFEILRDLSIDEYQGFYFSMPSPNLEVIRDA